tara:strand:+ start:5598 stop:6704 length:1107 start_codon:yes stop_codon:yes gene_type:complete
LKVAQVVNHFHPCIGGKESIVKELSLGLKQSGHKVSVFCLDKCAEAGKKLKPREQWNGIEINRFPFLDLRFLKVGFPNLGELTKADLVHAHGLCFLTDFLALTKFLYNKPLVLSTHGGIFHTKTISTLKRLYFYGWLKLIGGSFDKIIAVSKNDFELFSEIFPEEKMELIENAINVEKFGTVKRQARPNSFLFVGRLSRNKQVDKLLEAFAIVLREKPNAVLSIVGKDFDGILPELRKKAKELSIDKNVWFKGAVSDQKLLELYSENVFFVLASSYEGFGVSAIEAMAAGLVPILNTLPSFKSFVKEGSNGFIVDFENSESAARKMADACSLGTKLRTISANAKQSVQKFSWKEKLKEFEKVYNKTIF